MTIIKSILLGIVQGLTEFLPVSSSGHVAITQNLLNVPEERMLFLTVMLHFGTLISIFFVYYEDIFLVCKEFILMVLDVLKGRGLRLHNPHRKLGIFIIIATIPTGLMGIFFGDVFEGFFASNRIIGFSLIITGTLLWSAEKIHKGKRSVHNMKGFDALIIGIFQGLAITPGISRSGSTIVGALFRGLNKELATKFSFLIAVPSILGATLLETKDAFTYGIGDLSLGIILAGILASFLSGVFAIKTLINFIKREKLFYFSFYTWAIGSIIIILSFIN